MATTINRGIFCGTALINLSLLELLFKSRNFICFYLVHQTPQHQAIQVL